MKSFAVVQWLTIVDLSELMFRTVWMCVSLLEVV